MYSTSVCTCSPVLTSASLTAHRIATSLRSRAPHPENALLLSIYRGLSALDTEYLASHRLPCLGPGRHHPPTRGEWVPLGSHASSRRVPQRWRMLKLHVHHDGNAADLEPTKVSAFSLPASSMRAVPRLPRPLLGRLNCLGCNPAARAASCQLPNCQTANLPTSHVPWTAPRACVCVLQCLPCACNGHA